MNVARHRRAAPRCNRYGACITIQIRHHIIIHAFQRFTTCKRRGNSYVSKLGPSHYGWEGPMADGPFPRYPLACGTRQTPIGRLLRMATASGTATDKRPGPSWYGFRTNARGGPRRRGVLCLTDPRRRPTPVTRPRQPSATPSSRSKAASWIVLQGTLVITPQQELMHEQAFQDASTDAAPPCSNRSRRVHLPCQCVPTSIIHGIQHSATGKRRASCYGREALASSHVRVEEHGRMATSVNLRRRAAHLGRHCYLLATALIGSRPAVTKRVDTYGDVWKSWNWRSEGDLLLNGAYFIPSGAGASASYSRASSLGAKSSSMVGSITSAAGVLHCRRGSLC
ncbi:uncharacterized protein A4U43_C10F18420 [Asparagus officinalis]|uniref:Uncharacterized protein n=1 Tax=Asparagus officinalis TaxID=4686 RepID=A0A5P1E726_ASPOF|nr:uncharacterized protein A4U43_C10F18420 [Asparagus officinalis]